MYYVICTRLERHTKTIATLLGKEYRMVAYFGSDAAQPFKLLNQAAIGVALSARTLLSRAGGKVSDTDSEFLRLQEATIWAASTNDPNDLIAQDLDTAVDQIERICRPVLASPLVPHGMGV